ncbi:MAG: SUMF1/EgtB/PvdO family nonheme iron enzyme [Caldilineaceae bacterium]|nr:SUMF1/EgtB/PvdO family nonheme iron enzyme [Caldilineaceae bacterium]
MTTPTPLDQQRQLVRDFLAATQQRSARERTAQQQYAAGEKAANEQHASSERAAQQKFAAAIKVQDDTQRGQKSQIDQAVAAIDAARSDAREQLRMLGAPVADLPPALQDASPHQPTAQSGDPLAAFIASANRIQQLSVSAGRLLAAMHAHRAQQRRLLIGAAVVAVILAVAGYYFYQGWSHDQKLAGIYQAGVAALYDENWQVARDRFNELLALEPGYQDAQELVYESYYLAGKSAFDAGDWQVARDRFNELLALEPGYQDAQELLYESYFLAGKSAFDAGDWQAGLSQFSNLLRLRPGYADVRELINQHAEDIGSVTNPIDEALFVKVPAGEFLMGSPDGEGQDDEHPQHTVYLDAFWIMQTEVTNAQFARCVADGACSAPNNSRWQDATYADHPVTYVDWNQANSYAQWAGGRLPTEAEWEKAARGTDGRTWPWGEEQPAESLANCCDFVNDTVPVGSYPAGASPYGALGMAGNVWEWTADWYDSSYYGQSPTQNPTGPASEQFRVLRGGSTWNDANVVRVASRYRLVPDSRFRFIGFRVASSSPGF